jgi:hypothetical protein
MTFTLCWDSPGRSEKAKEMNGGKNLPLWQKAACGLTAGGLGALVGTPADLTLIRMQVSGAAAAGCWVAGGRAAAAGCLVAEKGRV